MVGTVVTTEAHPLQGWLPHFSFPTDCFHAECGLSVAISPEFSIEARDSDFAMNCPDQFLIKLLTVFLDTACQTEHVYELDLTNW